ncbi:MAG: hypothetical protein ACPIOQ_06970, partial [Promethearchaeia archaeon]
TSLGPDVAHRFGRDSVLGCQLRAFSSMSVRVRGQKTHAQDKPFAHVTHLAVSRAWSAHAHLGAHCVPLDVVALQLEDLCCTLGRKGSGFHSQASSAKIRVCFEFVST